MLGFNVKIRDIIDLSKVKLVIELDDTEKDPEGILSSFILTEEAERGIRGILQRIEEGRGCGSFIKGNFGSGKSHFLSFLYLLLKDKAHPILNDYKRVAALNLNLIKIPLVRYPASMGLEAILLKVLGYKAKVSDREEVFGRLLNGPWLIIIDELSEFLRSKETPPQFYEDIRFLQFLGEFSMSNPLWVVASLQEWIEETGHISSNIFNRIKDRYPLKINLTSSHLEHIIDQRLVIKREGFHEQVKVVFDELKRFYPNLELSLERFEKTYPLHPFTTRFLSGLTRVFSQHRGVIQFVQSETMKRLDHPPDSLITPEAIFDHFEDRIREIPEFSPLARIVFDYYKNHIPAIFNTPLQREIAEAAVKIMVLTEMSPLEKRKTARDMAEILLKKVSIATDRVNYDYIKEAVLDVLVAHQMYIIKETDTYFIDISQDEGIRVKGKIKKLRERFHDRDYLFTEIANHISLPYLPLSELKEGRRYRFTWQNSLREAIVLLATGLTQDDMERFQTAVQVRVDGYLLIMPPFHGSGNSSAPILSYKAAAPSIPTSFILLWQPAALTEEEVLFLEEFIAKRQLAGEFPSLKTELKGLEAMFKDIVTRVYFEGEVSSIGGRFSISLKDIGYLPMERLLSHLYDQPLKEAYPEHYKIMPKIDFYSSHHLNNLFNHLIKQGRLTIEEAEKRGLVPFITGILEPLGLVKRKGSTYTLSVSPEDEILSFILELSLNERDISKMRMALKRAKWGLVDDQIDLILASLVASGYLVPFKGEEVCELKELGQLASDVTSLRPGRAIDPALLTIIPKGRFIWGDIESAPTPATLRLMWREVVQFIRRYRKTIDELHNMMEKYKEYTITKMLMIKQPVLNRLSLFLHSYGLNISPHEGVERFLLFLKENEDLEGQIAYIERLHRFFTEEFQLLNKYYLYLTHPSLKAQNEMQGVILSQIMTFMRELGDFEEIRTGWDAFYDAYTTIYKEEHERYYQSPVFRIKGQIEDSPIAKTLKMISYIVSSVTFDKEWWEIKKRIGELPEVCMADLTRELFLNPQCPCGFTPGMVPPAIEGNLLSVCEEGIRNFLRVIRSSENREKIDSTITGLTLSGKRGLAKRLFKLINIEPEKTPIKTITALIDAELLQEIENAFKGRWRVKEVKIEDLIHQIKGRRFRYEELRQVLLRWIGEDTDSIIHVTGNDSLEDKIRDELSLYGTEGKRVCMDLLDGPVGLEDEPLAEALNTINLKDFEIAELLEILDKEKKAYMKKRVRGELFERLWNSLTIGQTCDTGDKVMADVWQAISLIKKAHRFEGVGLFTHVIAPISVIVERLLYENINEKVLEDGLVERLLKAKETLLDEYEGRPDRYEGQRGIEYVKERLSGNVVVMDGLRYDLWLIIRDIMVERGWRIAEEVIKIDRPSTTSNFRGLMAIWGDTGIIDNKTYSILKVAEKEIGKRRINQFLKENWDIRFFHFNLIDTRLHAASIDLYPLYEIIKADFIAGVIPIFMELGPFCLISDHGFTDTKRFKERYTHGGMSPWEVILPFAEVKL